jgi:hypothetical protein
MRIRRRIKNYTPQQKRLNGHLRKVGMQLEVLCVGYANQLRSCYYDVEELLELLDLMHSQIRDAALVLGNAQKIFDNSFKRKTKRK